MKALVVIIKFGVLIGCVCVLSSIVDAGTSAINKYQSNVDKVVNSI